MVLGLGERIMRNSIHGLTSCCFGLNNGNLFGERIFAIQMFELDEGFQ